MDMIEKKMIYLIQKGRFNETKKYIQHGSTSVYQHCLNVASMSVKIADKLPIKINRDALVTGALLHDYFLYDWHDGKKGRRLHGFSHPRLALKNAMEDYSLSPRTKNIIARHMFPLTLIPPLYLEAWIVCLADKICAVEETFFKNHSTSI